MLALSIQAITGWFTLFAGLGGAAVVGLFGWLGRKGDRDAAERQRKADAAERREETRTSHEQDRTDQRDQFQRETLLELQEVLHDLGRAYGREYHQDAMTARAASKWDPRQLDADISDKNFQAEQRTSILVARVGDERVRDAVREMREAGSRLSFAGSEAESGALILRSREAFDRANERIGELLRQL
jgi:hypothetical protein